ncbi:DUF397 domain-containing protein [Streptomyces sp. NPDC006552]|uniref:DUF397 domain-containing protein n=1 Tax=Streptomyces sp. NPDC006552 TaxID=3157179 RepID=UPI0033BE8702
MTTAQNWFKSSYSSDEGGACLEVAYNWTRMCTHPTAIHIRDSKNPEGPHCTVAPRAWAAFLQLPRA